MKPKKHNERNVLVLIDHLKLKAWKESAWPWPEERISTRIIMTHTHSIINLCCIIRKHESGHVVKVLLVLLLSSPCPDSTPHPPALPSHNWSFTERALIYVASWLLRYCLYVQSGLIMKAWGKVWNKERKREKKHGVKFDSDEVFLQSRTQAILRLDEPHHSRDLNCD